MRNFAFPLLVAALLLPSAASAQQGPPRGLKQFDKPPSETLPALKQVETLEGQGKLAEAQTALDQIRAANPTRVEPLIFIGQRLYERGPEQARPWFTQVLAADPGNVYAIAFLARIDAQTGRIDPARARLNAADAGHPDSLEIKLAHADVEMKRNNPTLALSFLGQARDLARPGGQMVQVQYRLADAYFALKQWQPAETALDQVLAVNPHPSRRLQRGDARAQLGKYAEALADYEAAGKSDMAKDPKFKAAVDARIAQVNKVANTPFAIDPANKLNYYALVSVADFVKNFAPTPTYHCNAGAYVIAIAEIQKQPIGDLSEAPIRKVGSPGKFGRALLSPDLLDPWKLMLLGTTMDKPEDTAAMKGRERLKFCP